MKMYVVQHLKDGKWFKYKMFDRFDEAQFCACTLAERYPSEQFWVFDRLTKKYVFTCVFVDGEPVEVVAW